MAQASSTSSPQTMVDDLKSKTTETFDSATEKLQDVASEARDQAQAVGGNVKSAIDKSVREQPLTTLAMAVAIGFVVGALWKS